jgi:hypothetical protein
MTRHDARMADFERQFIKGTKRAVLHAIDECISSRPQKPVPDWASREFGKALYDIAMANEKSLDDVFGRPHKGRKISQVRKQRALRYKVTKRVLELRRQRPRPKPCDIFQVVADENKISRPVCKRVFDAEMKQHRERNRFSKRLK